MFVAALLLIVGLFMTRHLPWSLDSHDQAKQAFVSYQMIENGDWWFQKTPDGDTATKPPLAGWISAGLYPLTCWQWFPAWLLPSLLSGLALVWMLDRGARRVSLDSPLDPWLLRSVAVAAVGLNLMAPHLASLVRTDMILSFFLFIPGYLIWKQQKERQSWTTGQRWLFASTVLASMMTKGPLIGTFVAPGLLVFWWWCRRRGVRCYGWAGWWPWLLPLGIFLLWVGAGILWHPGFFEDVVLKEFAGRVTGEHKSQPVYYYIGQLLTRLAPWSLLLIVLAGSRRGRELARQRPEILWLACWTLGALVVMSLIPSKRTDRIFPVVPPACLWLVELLAHWGRDRIGRFSRRGIAVGSVCLAALIASAYAGSKIYDARREDQGGLVRFGRAARALAYENGWPLAVANGRDEGLPMYAQVASFEPRKKICERWERGELSGVIIPEKQLERYLPELPGGRILLHSPRSAESGQSYVFYARQETP